MHEKLNTLPVAQLRERAKAAGIKGISSLKKAELIERLCAVSDASEQAEAAPEKTARKHMPSRRPKAPVQSQKPVLQETPASEPEPQAVAEPVEEPLKELPASPREAVEEAKSAPVISPYNSGEIVSGVLEIIQEGGFGFLRCENYLSSENDIFVSQPMIRRFNLKTGDYVTGMKRIKTAADRNAALLYINDVNGLHPAVVARRRPFESLTPIFPNERIHLETEDGPMATRIIDLVSPVGKGQRGMIVSPPKAGKTTLLKQTARAIQQNHPDIHLIILLIDERPEEVTDIRESLDGDRVEVIYSTFDETPEHHRRVSEIVLERAKRLVECHQDVVILLDSITRLARAYNLLVPPTGRTLSGGLDPTALYMPKQFFGAARNTREQGSLTILATALVETGSRMDDVIFEEFKGTGNMELVLDRKLSERRIFPAIDLLKSGTRREDLLLTFDEQQTMDLVRRYLGTGKNEETMDRVLDLFSHTKNNREFQVMVRKTFGNRELSNMKK